MSGLNKGDILKAQHGELEGKAVTFVVVKNEEVKKKLEHSPDILKSGEKNGEIWLAIPRGLKLIDFINKATQTQTVSFYKHVCAKYTLQVDL